MLAIDRVWKVYQVGAFGGRSLTAVRDVSLTVAPGQVVSVIGESGSGKSTLGRMVLRLASVTGGRISFEGRDIAQYRGRRLREYYRQVQGVFQDPFSSFNPIFKADRVLTMVREVYFPGTGRAAWSAKVEQALADVRLDPAAVLDRYPHQLSGGQLQRLLVARALLLDIKLLVADEIISMLDASTRIDVLNVLADLRARGLGILFVTHDLALGNYISDRTVILRKGVVVEAGATERVFANPRHPYAKLLLGSVPQLHRKWHEVAAELAAKDRRRSDECAYHAHAGADDGPLVEVEPDHYVGCFRSEDDPRCVPA